MLPLNIKTLIGRLGADVEPPQGSGPGVMRVAVNDRAYNKDTQEREEVTTWYRVTVWGKDAERAAEILKRGDQVFVMGAEKPPRVYIDRQGNPAVACEINCKEWRALTPPAAPRTARWEAPIRGGQAAAPRSTPAPAAAPFNDDDVPF